MPSIASLVRRIKRRSSRVNGQRLKAPGLNPYGRFVVLLLSASDLLFHMSPGHAGLFPVPPRLLALGMHSAWPLSARVAPKHERYAFDHHHYDDVFRARPERFAAQGAGRRGLHNAHADPGAGHPGVLAGRDLLGIAQTGTGKTAAFALPILHRLAADRRPACAVAARVLVLSPTRELATQIAESFRTYGSTLGITVAVDVRRRRPSARRSRR